MLESFENPLDALAEAQSLIEETLGDLLNDDLSIDLADEVLGKMDDVFLTEAHLVVRHFELGKDRTLTLTEMAKVLLGCDDIDFNDADATEWFKAKGSFVADETGKMRRGRVVFSIYRKRTLGPEGEVLGRKRIRVKTAFEEGYA